MVHALKEAWRVLVPYGIMIDVRPLSVDIPMEIVYAGGIESAGVMDLSPGMQKDIAADQAIESVIKEQIFIESTVEKFNRAYYWKTIKGMKADLEENWKDEVVIPEDVWNCAKTIVKKRFPRTQIRVGVRMKMGLYVKKQ
jgi:hypothetical protein